MKYKSENLDDTKKIAEKVAKSIKGNEILCLYGDLGSGKTTFSKMLAQSLGFKDDITSPTFIIRADHENNGMYLYHFDWYRLDDQKDLEMVGFYDTLGHGVVIIEWADKFSNVIEELESRSSESRSGGPRSINHSKVIRMYFKHVESGSRSIGSDGSRDDNIREIEVKYGNINN